MNHAAQSPSRPPTKCEMINFVCASIAVQALADAARKAGAEILRYRSARFSPVERASVESSTVRRIAFPLSETLK